MLISGAYASQVHNSSIFQFEYKNWYELWLNYLSEASRFDDKKLLSIFGEKTPIKIPSKNSEEWVDKDLRLIGEFLRRNHGSIAHEISLVGFPCKHNTTISFSSELPHAIKDISGFIARSHCYPIRESVDVIPRNNCRISHNIHIPYIMILLRIADYLHMECERAPQQVLKIRSIKSPFSQEEWEKHNVIKFIHNEHDDPEAIYIETDYPKAVKTFFKVKELLDNLQIELDSSWSVLGEVYGRFDGLKSFGLNIRRIKSNIYEDGFSNSLSYIPTKSFFDAAGVELLKNLIKPLYGSNSPEIGVRELLQNSIDACREVDDYISRIKTSYSDFIEQDSDVVITLKKDMNNKGGWLIISDRGIGMTVDVINKYFLKAGASFRQSDAWRELYIKQAKSRILRSGRFGVGVLSSFLIGNTIEVTTRHVTKPINEGIFFKCSIDDEIISLFHISCPIGTKIKIQISDQHIFDRLSEGKYWDWYCLEKPSLTRIILPENINLKQNLKFYNPTDKLPTTWRRLSNNDYDDIHWSYDKYAILACNGILICSSPILVIKDNDQIKADDKNSNRSCGGCLAPREEWDFSNTPTFFMQSGRSDHLHIKDPIISVFDKDGNLPLNLNRSNIVDNKIPFSIEVMFDIIRDFIAFLFVNLPEGSFVNPYYYEQFKNFEYKGVQSGLFAKKSVWNWWWCTTDGLSLSDPWHINSINPNVLICFPSLLNFPDGIFKYEKITKLNLVPFKTNDLYGTDIISWYKFIFGDNSNPFFGPYNYLNIIGRQILITRCCYESLKKNELIRDSDLASINEEWSNQRWILLSCGDFIDLGIDFEKIACESKNEECSSLATFYLNQKVIDFKKISPQVQVATHFNITNFDEKIHAKDDSMIASIWKALTESPTVPFNKEERNKLFQKSKKHIEDYFILNEKIKYSNPI